jgi:hypothetical protein
MISKLPQQFVKYLEKGAIKRREWLTQRMINIHTTIKSVIRKGEEVQEFDSEKDR